ncbi:MAG: hypothetical protein ACRENM_07325 [Candidatus Dormibacteraceae bacterium]
MAEGQLRGAQPFGAASVELRLAEILADLTDTAPQNAPRGVMVMHRTEDVARAAGLAARHDATEAGTTGAIGHALGFLESAFDPRSGRFRIGRRTGGDWLDQPASFESHARVLRGLSQIMGHADEEISRRRASRIFLHALAATAAFRDHRTVAASAIACADVVQAPMSGGAASSHLTGVGRRLAVVLADSMETGGPEWPWPAPVVSAGSATVPHAVLLAARADDRSDWLRYGIVALRWLVSAQMSGGNHLSLIGSQGWWKRGTPPASFDQRPGDALGLLEAAAVAHQITGDREWVYVAEAAFAWFLGQNDLGHPVAEVATGTCHDGLRSDGVDPATSLESALDWFSSILAMQALRDRLEADRTFAGARSAVS